MQFRDEASAPVVDQGPVVPRVVLAVPPHDPTGSGDPCLVYRETLLRWSLPGVSWEGGDADVGLVADPFASNPFVPRTGSFREGVLGLGALVVGPHPPALEAERYCFRAPCYC